MKCKISVIVPFYNGEKYISKCIDSIINQTLKELEIILVDDGSTDKSKNIANEYAKKYKNIKYIYQKNGRQGKARNNGLSHAKGEYISFIDSDDYISENMYEKMYNAAVKNNSDIVICDILKKYDDHDEYLSAHEFSIIDINNVTKQEYFLCEPGPCNKIFKRKFLNDNNFSFPEEIIDEDYAVIPALAIHNPKISYIPEAYYNYVQTSISTTRNQEYQKRNEDIFKATEILCDKALEDKEIFSELEYVVIKHLLYYSSLYFFQFDKKENLKKINDFIKVKFNKWYKNKYFKHENIRFKALCMLFFYDKTNILKLIIKLKKVGK